jgi:hypothetical protein
MKKKRARFMPLRRYEVREARGGKTDRYYVFDTLEKRVAKGKLSKEAALGYEGTLNGKPHKYPVV